MIYREIVHTCSNSYVADAAVISIGGEIAKILADNANRNAMSRGDCDLERFATELGARLLLAALFCALF